MLVEQGGHPDVAKVLDFGRFCADVDAWAWWARFGPTIKAAHDSASGTVSGLTVDVDMARRRGMA